MSAVPSAVDAQRQLVILRRGGGVEYVLTGRKVEEVKGSLSEGVRELREGG